MVIHHFDKLHRRLTKEALSSHTRDALHATFYLIIP